VEEFDKMRFSFVGSCPDNCRTRLTQGGRQMSAVIVTH